MREDRNPSSVLRKNFYISIIFLIVLLLFNFVVWQVNKSHYVGKARDSFNEYSRDIKLLINKDLNTYYSNIGFSESLFKSSTEVTRNEFELFHQNLAETNLAGTNTIDSVVYVQKTTNKQEFEKKVRSEQTNPPLQNYAFSVYPTGERSQYWVINYMSPKTQNRTYFGYDVLADSAFGEDFIKAAEEGVLVATKRKIFIDKEYILLIKPIYTNNLQIRTKDEREKSLSGFVVFFLNPDTLFAKVSEYFEEDYRINVKVSVGHLQKNQIKIAEPLFEDARNIQVLVDNKKKQFEGLSYSTFGDKQITIYTTAEVSEQLGMFEGIISDSIFAFSNLITIVFFLLVAEMNSHDPEEKHLSDKT